MRSRITTLCLIVALAITVCGAPTQAQGKPDVNGTWKMNRAKSQFGRGSGPEAITIKFEQQDSTLREALTVVSQQGERTVNANYTLDGKESINQIQGMDVKATARWEGSSLLLEFKNDEFLFQRKITLSADGKVMTIAVHQTSPNGEQDDTVVLEKQ